MLLRAKARVVAGEQAGGWLRGVVRVRAGERVGRRQGRERTWGEGGGRRGSGGGGRAGLRLRRDAWRRVRRSGCRERMLGCGRVRLMRAERGGEGAVSVGRDLWWGPSGQTGLRPRRESTDYEPNKAQMVQKRNFRTVVGSSPAGVSACAPWRNWYDAEHSASQRRVRLQTTFLLAATKRAPCTCRIRLQGRQSPPPR